MSANKQLGQVLLTLNIPPTSRSDADVDLCHAYFRNTKFFKAIGRDSEAARECCKHLVLQSFEDNDPVCLQGDPAQNFYYVLEGSVRVLNEGLLLGEHTAGDSFGELSVMESAEKQQKQPASVIANERTHLASLHCLYYRKAVGGFVQLVYKGLKIPPMQRSRHDLAVLLAQFESTEIIQKLHFISVQLKCCKYMTVCMFKRNQKIELKKGQKHLCILIDGGLSLSMGNKVMRSLGENDSFMGDSVAADGGVLTGTKDGAFAVLSKQNYDEATTNVFAQVKHILNKPPQKRTRKELDFSMEMFCHSAKTLPFFRAIPSVVLRKNSCKMLGCRELTKNSVLFREGDAADCLYIIIDGTVVINGELTLGHDQVLSSGCEFGHFDGVGGKTEDKVKGSEVMNQRAATAKVTSDMCLVAMLAKSDFSRLCQLDEIQIWIHRLWKLITTKEPSNDTELLRFFDELDTDGSGDLDRYEIYKLLDSLGRKPTEQQLDNFMATMDPDGSGEVDFNEFSSWWWERHAEARTSTAPAERPDMRATFQSVDADGSGVVDYDELLIGLRNMRIVKTEEDKAAVQVLMAEFDVDASGALDYEEFCALTRKLQAGKTTLAILDSKTAPTGIDCIEFAHYQLLHSRIAKSLAPDFTEQESEVSGREDWKEDLQRFGNRDDKMNQQQFGHAIFQLVDEWCGGASSTQMIVGWLRMLFSNIVSTSGKLKELDEIGCIDDELNNMCEGQRRNDEQEKNEAEQRFKEQAAELRKAEKAQSIAKAKADTADKAKRQKEKKAQVKKQQKEKKDKAAKARAEKTRKNENANSANVQVQSPKKQNLSSGVPSRQAPPSWQGVERAQSMSALDNEEAELLRRLESGELSAEEEARAKARLKEIEEGRRAPSVLDTEEAELLRLLESGRLSVEQEAEVRSRLAAIVAEREAGSSMGQTSVAGSATGAVDRAQLTSQLAQFDASLSALDSEEADLLRRLQQGDLTPEEEAEIRARLQAISEERKEVVRQRGAALAAAGQQTETRIRQRSAELAAELAGVDGRLSALDDEEATLLRKLQSGELSEEEARAVRNRLEAIAKERQTLLEQRKTVMDKQADHERRTRQNEMMAQAAAKKQAVIAKRLAALDDEETELLRRLASGKLSAAEAKAVRARLDAIAAERKALQLQAEVTGGQEALAGEIAHVEERIRALDDEEAELMRRLESGELTAEEEAQIRARLAAIAGEREALRDKQQLLLRKQREMDTDARNARFDLELMRLNNQLGMLDDEEAALLRRLAAGDLSTDEEAEIRARLAAIDRERAALQKKIERSKQLAHGSKKHIAGARVILLKRNMAKFRAAAYMTGRMAMTLKAKAQSEKADSHAFERTDSSGPVQQIALEQRGQTLSDQELETRARALRRERSRRRREILKQARDASASSIDCMQHHNSTILFNTRQKVPMKGHLQPRGVSGTWYRWKELAEQLDGGWSTAVATEYDRQNRRPSTAQRQLQHQDELQRSRSRRTKSQIIRQRSKVMIDVARSERRRTRNQYIAAKIATEHKVRQAKGFTLPTFGPGPRSQIHDVSRASTPTYVTQERRRPDTSPHSTYSASSLHPFDQHPQEPVDNAHNITFGQLANPNLNQGRGLHRSSSSMSISRPNSVAW